MMLDRRQALSVLGAAALYPRSAAASDTGARINAIIADKLEAEHVPGGAFLAVRNGEIVHAATFGVRDRELNLPVTLDTLFPIGSATKPFTSMAAGVLQDQGLLKFGDHPREYLPWFRLRDQEADARVTIRDMLSHTVGLRAYADLAAEPAVLTREEYVRAVMSARPEYPFRSRFQYSNGMITAVGLILGAVKGTTWEEAVAQEVMRPLGMRQALASFEDLPSRPDHAIGYVYDPADAGWRATPPPRSLIAMAPAGAICASANELALWLKALTNDGAPLVGAKTFNELTDPQIAISASMAYALAWGVYGWNGMKVVEHNGGSRGICALVSFIPQARTGFVFLGNTSPNFLTRIGSLGPLIYPLLLNIAAPTEARVRSAQPLIPLPPKVVVDERVPPPLPALSLEEVLEKVRSAPGNPGTERRQTLFASGVKSYESQGITALATLHAAAPASREEREIWRAADREIGRLRVYFDGQAGGQETTFGQDAVNDAATSMAMRRDFDFRPWRHLLALYPKIAVGSAGWINDRAVLRLDLGEDEGHFSVDLDDWLVVEREKGGVRTLYSDYRCVDGEWVAYRTETHDGLGLTTLQWYEVVFDKVIPSAAFEAAVPAI